jgi:biotin carboxyl carrier protein
MSDFIVTIDEEKFSVNTNNFHNIRLNGSEFDSQITQLSEHTYKVNLNNKIFHVTTNKLSNNELSFLISGHYFEAFVRTKLEDEALKILSNKAHAQGEYNVKSPMPGLVLKLYKTIRDEVNEGEPLLLLEAMKMENIIKSPATGIIKEIQVKEGKSVEKNQSLIFIQSIQK